MASAVGSSPNFAEKVTVQRNFTAREVVMIFEIIWEVLFNCQLKPALIPSSIHHIRRHPSFPETEICFYRLDRRRYCLGHTQRVNIDVDTVDSAYRKKNYCDAFCNFLEEPIKAKLRELDLGACRWLRFEPRIHTYYLEIYAMFPSILDLSAALFSFVPTNHSVLEVTSNLADEIIFDGTAEQFGWQGPIMHRGDVEEDRVRHGTCAWEPTDDDKGEVEEAIRSNGQLLRMRIQLDEFLEELDWQLLARLSDPQLSTYVRTQAESKFAHA